MKEDIAISLSHLSKYYKQNGEFICAVDDISLDLIRSHMICIIGPSGSGKSTILKI